jgi:CheY-like chemotaxis protein
MRELRASNDQRLQTIPAIAVSAYARREDQERALRAGFQLHITKPVAPGDLIQGIAAILPRGV